MSVFDILTERGFIAQLTHEKEIKENLETKKITYYAGFDPTADSLHVGHLLPIMAMAHMQKDGHKPIALLGGGTAMIGDPSGKEEMRKMLTLDDIDENIRKIKLQIGKLIDFSDGKGILVNNGDWIRELNYVNFLRDIGVNFSVNRMLTAECFKQRLNKGLSFIEFNYMLLQGYDYLVLNREYDCTFEIGGDDQWSNILAGADLVRRKERKEVYGLTLNLITTSSGKKMGKTEKGAVWLDPKRTSPYEYYQYWRNTHDGDVRKFLNLFTFLNIDKVNELGALKDSAINEAKKVLAFEATKLMHGEDEAIKAEKASSQLFEGNSQGGGSIPSAEYKLDKTVSALELFLEAKIIKSKGEGRKLIKNRGLSINGKIVESHELILSNDDVNDEGIIVLKKGKKTFFHMNIV